MTNKTIENLVEEKVLNKLKDYDYLTTQEVIDLFEPLCDNSEDLDEILDIVINSDRYNYIITQGGDGYIFGTKRENICELVNSGYIRHDDPCWNDYVTCGASSYKLNYFVDEETINNQVYEGIDVYTKDYDYEDVKVAICVAEFLNKFSQSFEFETVIKIAIKIRNKWEERQKNGLLTEEEYIYIQKFAVDYLYENKNKIMEESKPWN